MTRDDYREKLKDLRQNVLYMSDLVCDRLRKSMKALEERDDDLAWEVIEGDSEVNDLYLDLEQDCIDLLALQQPVAGDLRLIAASFKIITDLERIGDLAVNLADYSVDAEKHIFPEVNIQVLADDVFEMVEDSMEAYENEDVELCYEVSERDESIDEECDQINQRVIRELIEKEHEMSDDEVDTLLREVSRLLLTVRDLERVGDHSVNIAARTLYMVENDDELIW
ncbi:MAG: phosphate signaling complex protein PhoU [Halobacteria archaeon]|nr:phosphate signaling complex protein PhoU [Halobacteria archaeon]